MGLRPVADALRAQGGQLIAISIDSPDQSRQTAQRHQLNFSLLSDLDGQVIRDYGLLHASAGPGGKDIAIPAMVLIDRQGRIAWRRMARRIQDRPHPQELLRLIGQ